MIAVSCISSLNEKYCGLKTFRQDTIRKGDSASKSSKAMAPREMAVNTVGQIAKTVRDKIGLNVLPTEAFTVIYLSG